MTLRIVPRDIGDGAQHRIEHDGARALGGAVRFRDRAILVENEGERAGADRGQPREIAGRGSPDAVSDDPVFVEPVGFAKEGRKLFRCARRSGRAEKRQHDPAPGGDMKVDRRAGNGARAEPRHRIAERNLGVRLVVACHDRHFHRPALRPSLEIKDEFNLNA